MKLFRALLFLLPLACSETPEFQSDPSPKAIRETSAIQGGTVDQTSTNVVAILLSSADGVGICSGSLIAPNLVLTARHCVGDTTGSFTSCSVQPFSSNNPYATSAFRITTSYNAAGQVFNGQAGWPTVNNTTWFGAAQIITDTDTSSSSSATNSICGGDVALIRLSANVTGICPLIPRVDSNIQVGDTYTATGFGITSATSQTGAGTRRTVTGMSVVCMNSCSGSTCCNSNAVMSGTLEWEGGSTQQKGTCEGDSGGPALDSLNRVIGAVSRGPGNACNDTAYSGVYGHREWIKAQTLLAATAGSYTAPSWANGASTTANPCTGVDGGVTGGGTGSTGGGTGATGGGTGGSGGGDPQGTCASGEVCADFTGQSQYQCIGYDGTNYSMPSGSVPCTASGSTYVCASGKTCYNLGNSNYYCFPDCTPTTGTGGGTGATGGGTGSTGGGTGTQNPDGCYGQETCFTGPTFAACLDLNTSTGIPAGAATCNSTTPCASGFSCFGSGTSGSCLRDCPGVPNTCTGGNYCVSWSATDHVCATSGFDPPAGAQDCFSTGTCPSGYECECTAGTTSCTAAACLQLCGTTGPTGGGTGATGGGTGTTTGGGTGTTTGGGTGTTTGGGTGTTTGGGTGTTTGGGTGTTTGGGTGTTTGGGAGGTTGGGTGTTTGGGTGGTTGGGTGTTGGGSAVTGGGAGSTGGSGGTTGGGTGLIWPSGGGTGGGGSKSDSGCSCTEAPVGSLMWLALSGLGLLRRRRR